MTAKKRTYEADSLNIKPLQIRRKAGRDHLPVEEHLPSTDKLRLPESRDLVLRLIEKIKQQ